MMGRVETLELNSFKINLSEIREKTALMNKQFETKVEPFKGIYGTTENVKDGITILRGKTVDGRTYREYSCNGKTYQRHELLDKGKNRVTYFDDNGSPYSSIAREKVGVTTKITGYELFPDTVIVKNNFTAQTDGAGRVISTKVTDAYINNANRPATTGFKVDYIYSANDEVGHGIAHNLGGPTGPENLFPQNQNVNRSAFKKVENEVKSLVEQGKKVDYEVKANYVGTERRPSSFEPKITVDGLEHPLPDELKKIYNDPDTTAIKKAVTDAGEVSTIANDAGIKSGLVAAGITFAVSTADNFSAFIDGEITADEMVVDIVKETAAAGAIEYGAEFISTAASQAMSKSSSQMIQRVAGSTLPVAVVSFAVESYDSVSAYAKGEIDGEELAYELGENAVTVEAAMACGQAGATLGAKIGGVIGSVAGPGGTVVGATVGGVAGGIVGGVVGAAVASEAYATAVELGAEGVEFLAEQAENLMNGTLDLFQEHIPDKWDEAKDAFSSYIEEFDLPFGL